MEASVGHTVVVDDTAVGYVEGGHRSGEVFAEIFAQGKIECGVAGEILAGIRPAWNTLLSVVESRAVVDVRGDVGARWEVDVAANVERIALVVIERAKIRLDVSDRVGTADVGVVEASGDYAASFCDLVGVGEVNLGTVGDARRAQREFP